MERGLGRLASSPGGALALQLNLGDELLVAGKLGICVVRKARSRDLRLRLGRAAVNSALTLLDFRLWLRARPMLSEGAPAVKIHIAKLSLLDLLHARLGLLRKSALLGLDSFNLVSVQLLGKLRGQIYDGLARSSLALTGDVADRDEPFLAAVGLGDAQLGSLLPGTAAEDVIPEHLVGRLLRCLPGFYIVRQLIRKLLGVSVALDVGQQGFLGGRRLESARGQLEPARASFLDWHLLVLVACPQIVDDADVTLTRLVLLEVSHGGLSRSLVDVEGFVLHLLEHVEKMLVGLAQLSSFLLGLIVNFLQKLGGAILAGPPRYVWQLQIQRLLTGFDLEGRSLLLGRLLGLRPDLLNRLRDVDVVGLADEATAEVDGRRLKGAVWRRLLLVKLSLFRLDEGVDVGVDALRGDEVVETRGWGALVRAAVRALLRQALLLDLGVELGGAFARRPQHGDLLDVSPPAALGLLRAEVHYVVAFHICRVHHVRRDTLHRDVHPYL